MRQRAYATNSERQRAYRERKRNAADTAIVTLPAPYYQDDRITLYCGDCTTLLPLLSAGSVDLVLTDPPYGISEAGGDILYGDGYRKVQDFGAWDRAGWTPDLLLREAARLLLPGGSLIAFTSDLLLSRYLTSPYLARRGCMAWEKTNPVPKFRPSYRAALEFIAWLAKPGAAVTWQGGGTTTNVFRYPICAGEERSEHPTQKPLRLIKRLLQLHSNAGDLVLDPFAGSGTTLAAAKLMGRRAIGIELDERYCLLAAQRLCQDVMDFEVAA